MFVATPSASASGGIRESPDTTAVGLPAMSTCSMTISPTVFTPESSAAAWYYPAASASAPGCCSCSVLDRVTIPWL